MKQITITVPDNCKLKQDGNTYTIVEKKEKKLTYKDILIELKPIINTKSLSTGLDFYATSYKMFNKLHAINKLMTVAKYLNGDWQPDWKNRNEDKWCIEFDYEDNILSASYNEYVCQDIVYFKSEKLAEQAIEILGEETIKLALCTNY